MDYLRGKGQDNTFCCYIYLEFLYSFLLKLGPHEDTLYSSVSLRFEADETPMLASLGTSRVLGSCFYRPPLTLIELLALIEVLNCSSN